jgi:hypothetical protein
MPTDKSAALRTAAQALTLAAGKFEAFYDRNGLEAAAACREDAGVALAAADDLEPASVQIAAAREFWTRTEPSAPDAPAPCPECGGDGRWKRGASYAADDNCPTCRGSGEAPPRAPAGTTGSATAAQPATKETNHG